ncbi:MAG: 23S rRNA (adenine(2030)-N(6))-methyltransferase RlmJ [Rhizobiaceae bacterium]|nr:23S rRNA (adenine(2030)-N(6))-methyltransferase RlmJ [Rhizobiaceae bacterium]
MNYRHAFHAGNFADVVKHAVLARLVDYLQRKDAAYRVIDTHAGIGLYDLTSPAAQKTGEWRDGIGRLAANPPQGDAGQLMERYLAAVAAANPEGGLLRYPGSPWLSRHLARRQDRLTAVELHPEDAETLRTRFAGDHQIRIIALDGWLALGAHVPPKEKRGLVLIDPPFEEAGEFSRMAQGLTRAYRRWPGGIYALWYPIKDRKAVAAFRAALKTAGIPKIVDIRLEIRSPSPEPRLDGCGMMVINPPFVLESEMNVILPALHRAMAIDGGGGWAVERLTGEQPAA